MSQESNLHGCAVLSTCGLPAAVIGRRRRCVSSLKNQVWARNSAALCPVGLGCDCRAGRKHENCTALRARCSAIELQNTAAHHRLFLAPHLIGGGVVQCACAAAALHAKPRGSAAISQKSPIFEQKSLHQKSLISARRAEAIIACQRTPRARNLRGRHIRG